MRKNLRFGRRRRVPMSGWNRITGDDKQRLAKKLTPKTILDFFFYVLLLLILPNRVLIFSFSLPLHSSLFSISRSGSNFFSFCFSPPSSSFLFILLYFYFFFFAFLPLLSLFYFQICSHFFFLFSSSSLSVSISSSDFFVLFSSSPFLMAFHIFLAFSSSSFLIFFSLPLFCSLFFPIFFHFFCSSGPCSFFFISVVFYIFYQKSQFSIKKCDFFYEFLKYGGGCDKKVDK